ncbi:hypothetical protein NDU88_001782 [Pleurodeles waltl]|uniref:ribonuclease H n=1 Tax=Pleurodeles waltl TaxID=8319 RepID=A0AAV7U8X4_PLEWA|nr:hypothetical protein NDU88_001782 [Pleurodeles waltl]
MWESITSDSWVISVVRKGYALPFREIPPTFPPRPSFCSEDHLLLLEQEVLSLLLKGAVELVPEQERGQGCYSRYFPIPKKDGRLRPILDLRILNWFLKQEKFKMLTLAQVLMALNKEDWMVLVDLQDAYFHIPILKSHRKYLRFVVGSQHYQFAVLPFGLTSAPRVFTKVMAVVAADLRRKGIAVFPYLDDWLIKAESQGLVLHHLQLATQLFFSLGFSINVSKSHLEPSQRLLFIGAVLDTTLNQAFPPPQRIQDIQALSPMFQEGGVVPILKVLRLLGLFASCILLVTHARWHMRALQWCLRRQWFQHRGDLRESIRIFRDTAADLRWWAADDNLSQSRKAVFAASSGDHSDNGCLHFGVGSPFGGPGNQGSLVSSRADVSYQSAGTAGDSFGPQGLPPFSSRSVCSGSNGQQDCDVVYQQAGRCRVAPTLQRGSATLVQGSGPSSLRNSKPSGRGSKCACGQSQSVLLRRSRVASSSGSGSLHLSDMGFSPNRPIFHSGEHTLPVVLQPSVSDTRSVGGHVSDVVVRLVALRVSPHTLDSLGSEEDSPRPG